MNVEGEEVKMKVKEEVNLEDGQEMKEEVADKAEEE